MMAGGAERVIATLLNNIDKSKFRKIYLIVLNGEKNAFYLNMELINFIDLKCSRVRYSFIKIIFILWKIRPDIIFSTLNHLNLYLAALRPILPRAIYIGRESSILTDANKFYGNKKIRNLLSRILYKNLDKIVCQSAYMFADLNKNFLIKKSKLALIYNPVDYTEIINSIKNKMVFSNNYDLNLTFVGRLSAEKNLKLLLESIRNIKDFSIELLIVGEGPEYRELMNIASSIVGTHSIKFLGFIYQPYDVIKSSDFLILCSRFEGLPNVALEALALDVPVISLPSPGGIPEIIKHQFNGFISKEMSPKALTNTIREAYNAKKNKISPWGSESLLPEFCKVDFVINEYMRIFEGEN